MSKKYVIGHQNPDTDSVVSAIILSWFLNEQEQDYRPAALGEINKETSFVLSFWGFEKPEILSKKEADGAEFFLVDHNDLNQSIASSENVKGVLDHHLIAGLKTSTPIFFRIEPVGSSATLVYKLIKENNLKPSKKHCGLLLSAIISDTLNLNSPTTTTEDIDTLYELKDLTGADTEKLANEMFVAKSDFNDKKVSEVITADLKNYDFGGKKIGIGVAETTSLRYFQDNSAEIIKELKNIKGRENYDALYFAVIDIINQNSYFCLPSEDEEKIIREVFKGKEKENFFFVESVSSRKKEIAPPLSDYYS